MVKDSLLPFLFMTIVSKRFDVQTKQRAVGHADGHAKWALNLDKAASDTRCEVDNDMFFRPDVVGLILP